MHGRSRTGCMTCRKRKLKCDEQKPVCRNCQKANRDCVLSGLALRHDHNPSLNHGDGINHEHMKSFYAYKNTFAVDSIWVKIPTQISFVVITNPYEDDPPPVSVADPAPEMPQKLMSEGYQAVQEASGTMNETPFTYGLEALSAAASADADKFEVERRGRMPTDELVDWPYTQHSSGLRPNSRSNLADKSITTSSVSDSQRLANPVTQAISALDPRLEAESAALLEDEVKTEAVPTAPTMTMVLP